MTSLLPNGMQVFLDENGAPLASGTVWFYELDGVTPKDTWQDPDEDTLNTNPVELDAAGRATIWGSGWYRQIVRKESVTADPEDGELVWDKTTYGSETNTIVMECTVDGNGAEPTPGICGDLYVPFACTLTAAVLQATDDGSIEFDVWVAPFVAGTPPTIANTIVGGNYPTISTDNSSIDSTLSDWDIDVPANSWIRFNLNSVTDIFHCTLSLVAHRSVG